MCVFLFLLPDPFLHLLDSLVFGTFRYIFASTTNQRSEVTAAAIGFNGPVHIFPTSYLQIHSLPSISSYLSRSVKSPNRCITIARLRERWWAGTVPGSLTFQLGASSAAAKPFQFLLTVQVSSCPYTFP
jgi:hypothetical protein